MFKSVIETIFIFVTLSILSRHLTKADTQNLALSFGAIDQDQFAVHPHPRFDRVRRATDDAINFPKEEQQAGNAQAEVPKVANEGEANVNGTDVESRFGFLGGGRRGFGGGFGRPGFGGGGLYPGGGFGGPGYGGYGPGYGGYPGGGYYGPGFGR